MGGYHRSTTSALDRFVSHSQEVHVSPELSMIRRSAVLTEPTGGDAWRTLRTHLVRDHGRSPDELDGSTLAAIHALEHFDYGDGVNVADHDHDDPACEVDAG